MGIEINIDALIAFCDHAADDKYNHDICDKCPVHITHTMFGIDLICQIPEDMPDNYRSDIEEAYEDHEALKDDDRD